MTRYHGSSGRAQNICASRVQGARLCAMKPPLYIRHVTAEERAALTAGLRSHDAFTVRRCQIWLASAERQKPSGIAKTLRCAPQTVRNVLHAFNAHGLACVQRGSNVPLQGRARAERRHTRAVTRHLAPKPPDLWPAGEYVDPQTAGRRLPRAGPERHDPLRSHHAGCHRPLGGQLATRQTLDGQS